MVFIYLISGVDYSPDYLFEDSLNSMVNSKQEHNTIDKNEKLWGIPGKSSSPDEWFLINEVSHDDVLKEGKRYE